MSRSLSLSFSLSLSLYIYICISIGVYVCVRARAKMYKYEKRTQGLQDRILFIEELFARVKRFGFCMKLSSGRLNM